MSEWNDRLTASVNNAAGFAREFDQLKATNLDLPALKALCKEFRGETSSSKTDAYRKILARHQSAMDGQARTAATGRRSAA